MVVYRKDIIFDYIKGKDVLDLGSTTNKKQMFDIMKKLAKSVVGVDLRKSKDPQIIYGNAENVKINKKFDLVVAGEIIEHLNNAGVFLDNMGNHLRKGGRIIITTPNVKSPAYLLFKGNEEHTCWYCKYTLKELVQRHGFKVEKVKICVQKKKNFIVDLLRYYFANNLVFICRKK